MTRMPALLLVCLSLLVVLPDSAAAQSVDRGDSGDLAAKAAPTLAGDSGDSAAAGSKSMDTFDMDESGDLTTMTSDASSDDAPSWGGKSVDDGLSDDQPSASKAAPVAGALSGDTAGRTASADGDAGPAAMKSAPVGTGDDNGERGETPSRQSA